MNQLGGVGRISNKFASTADGVHSESQPFSRKCFRCCFAGSSNGNNSSSDINNSIMLQWQGTEDFYDESEPYGLAAGDLRCIQQTGDTPTGRNRAEIRLMTMYLCFTVLHSIAFIKTRAVLMSMLRAYQNLLYLYR